MSSYMIKSGRKIYSYSPGNKDYTIDYENSDTSIIYVPQKTKASVYFKLKYMGIKNGNLTYLLNQDKKKQLVVIPGRMDQDSFQTSFCYPGYFLFNHDYYSNSCQIRKEVAYKQAMYMYHYVKDTVVLTNSGLKNCVVNTVSLINSAFYNAYPFKIYIDKNTGVPLLIGYPYCDRNTDKESIEYHYTFQEKEKTFFLLNKRRSLW